MRKKRSLYKTCVRLGYNAMLRKWPSKRKSLELRYEERKTLNTRKSRELDRSQRRITTVLTNNDRLQTTDHSEKKNTNARRKDFYGNSKKQLIGRKRRYGNVLREKIRSGRSSERKLYRIRKKKRERAIRHGIPFTSMPNSLLEDSHRRSGIESRVDVRRWRSGRVDTIQKARDRIEHEIVHYRNVDGSQGDVVKWQGDCLKIGQGRSLKKNEWINRKNQRTWELLGLDRNLDVNNQDNLSKFNDYSEYCSSESRNRIDSERDLDKKRLRIGAPYRDVDYVSGSRIYIRKPSSKEVIVPSGRCMSTWVRRNKRIIK